MTLVKICGHTSAEDAAASAERFGRDAALFGRVLDAMLNGNRKMNIKRVRDPDARDKLAEVADSFETVHELVGRILEQTPTLFEAQQASHALVKQSEVLLGRTTDLMQAYTTLGDTRAINATTGSLLGAVAGRWALGADGIELYNYYAADEDDADRICTWDNMQADYSAIHHLHDLDSLRGLDKQYALTTMLSPVWNPPFDTPDQLPQILLPTGEDLSACPCARY